jgi:hypothetical protein
MLIVKKKIFAEFSSFFFKRTYCCIIKMYNAMEDIIIIEWEMMEHNPPFIFAKCPPIIKNRLKKKNGTNILSIKYHNKLALI